MRKYNFGLENADKNDEYYLILAEDFTSNALLRVRLYWTDIVSKYVKPFLILVSTAPRAPIKKYVTKNFLFEKPYRISLAFSIDELAAFAHALDNIASGTAELQGIGQTWEKRAEPLKVKAGKSNGIGKKRILLAPSLQNSDSTGRCLNLNFQSSLSVKTRDPLGFFKPCTRDDQQIMYEITVSFDPYQAMAIANNLFSLVDSLSQIDRHAKFALLRETQHQCESFDAQEATKATRISFRLHQNARCDLQATHQFQPENPALAEDCTGTVPMRAGHSDDDHLSQPDRQDSD
jgi:hypothetical protein